MILYTTNAINLFHNRSVKLATWSWLLGIYLGTSWSWLPGAGYLASTWEFVEVGYLELATWHLLELPKYKFWYLVAMIFKYCIFNSIVKVCSSTWWYWCHCLWIIQFSRAWTAQECSTVNNHQVDWLVMGLYTPVWIKVKYSPKQCEKACSSGWVEE